MDWLEPGQSIAIKPALNSAGLFPFTSSPASVAALVRMSLERDAGKVYVVDEKGFEHTMLKQWKTGQFTGFDKDLTIKAFKKTGIHDAVMQVADELGARDRVHITTFREALGMTQKELGEALGVDGMTVSRWERGALRPSAASLQAIEKLRKRAVRRGIAIES